MAVWVSLATGSIALGIWVAGSFALSPLLTVLAAVAPFAAALVIFLSWFDAPRSGDQDRSYHYDNLLR
jgi:hypothetical protein